MLGSVSLLDSDIEVDVLGRLPGKLFADTANSPTLSRVPVLKSVITAASDAMGRGDAAEAKAAQAEAAAKMLDGLANQILETLEGLRRGAYGLEASKKVGATKQSWPPSGRVAARLARVRERASSAAGRATRSDEQ